MPWAPPELAWLPLEGQDLLRFACTRMVHSYKPVLMLAVLDLLPATEFPVGAVADAFLRFYEGRGAQGLPVERRGCRFMADGAIDPMLCRHTAEAVLRDVFESLRHCLTVERGTVALRDPVAWCTLKQPPHERPVTKVLEAAIDAFYERIELQGEAVYGQQWPATAQTDQVVFLLPDPDDGDDLCLLWPNDQ